MRAGPPRARCAAPSRGSSRCSWPTNSSSVAGPHAGRQRLVGRGHAASGRRGGSGRRSKSCCSRRSESRSEEGRSPLAAQRSGASSQTKCPASSITTSSASGQLSLEAVRPGHRGELVLLAPEQQRRHAERGQLALVGRELLEVAGAVELELRRAGAARRRRPSSTRRSPRRRSPGLSRAHQRRRSVSRVMPSTQLLAGARACAGPAPCRATCRRGRSRSSRSPAPAPPRGARRPSAARSAPPQSCTTGTQRSRPSPA